MIRRMSSAALGGISLKTAIPILVICVVVSASGLAQSSNPATCSPASYHGLIIGKSTWSEVLKTLGKPEAFAREEDTGSPYWSYTTSDPVPGWLMVFTSKGLLTGLRIVLKSPLSKEQTLRLYGPDLLSVHYDFDDCLGGGGAGPVYVSPDGPIEDWEYRGKGKGIVISVDRGQAQEIAFGCGPIGPPRSRCAARGAKTNPSGSSRQPQH